MVIGLNGDQFGLQSYELLTKSNKAKRESDLLITSMITDWIGLHNVLLQVNQNYNRIGETREPSIERSTVLERRYECWKTQQFTQQCNATAWAKWRVLFNYKHDEYTVQLMFKSGCW